MKQVQEDAKLLHDACRAGDATLIRQLLKEENNVDVNKADYRGWTPLHWACCYEYKRIAELLIDRGADINKTNNYGETPLFMACYFGYKDIAEFLIRRGADVNKANVFGRTPLHEACFSGRLDIAKFLIEYGYGANTSKVSILGETPLYTACFHGNINIADLLIEYDFTLGHNIARFLTMQDAIVPGDLVRDIYRSFSGEKQFIRYFTSKYILPIRRTLCQGTLSPSSSLSALRGFGHIINHICLLNVPGIIRKWYPEKELH